MIFKNSIILWRLLEVEIKLGFRSKVLVTLRRCSLKTSHSPPISETMKSFSEIMIFLGKLHLPENDGLIIQQQFLLSDISFGFTL